METTAKKKAKATAQKTDLTPIPNHPLKKWFGTFKDDPYWEDFALRYHDAGSHQDGLRHVGLLTTSPAGYSWAIDS